MLKSVNGITREMTAEEIAEYEASLPTAEELEAQRIAKLKQDIETAIQSMLDGKARELRWDNIKSARAGAGVPLDGTESEAELAVHNQAVSLAKWDRAIWGKSIEIEAEGVEYTVEEVLEKLPKYEGS